MANNLSSPTVKFCLSKKLAANKQESNIPYNIAINPDTTRLMDIIKEKKHDQMTKNIQLFVKPH